MIPSKKRERTQVGNVHEINGRWYVRYRRTEIRNGQPKRVQVSEYLCDKSPVYYPVQGKPCKALRLKRDEVMLRVNSQTGASQAPLTVAQFWDSVYVQWAEEVNTLVGEPNLRASTLTGYKQIWGQHLKDHFGGTLLRDYDTATATKFLTTLAKSQGRNTVHHIRSLMSGIFSHAVSVGYIDTNPIKDAQALGKTARPAKTGHYTLREALAILAALADFVECQLVMALAFFWGLRPSEVRGLQWSDFCYESSEHCEICQHDDWQIEVAHAHIQRAIDKQGNVTDLKTDEAEQPLPLMVPIAMALQVWRERCGDPKDGWVFQNANGKPADLRDWVRTKIRLTLAVSKLKWKGLYAGRRGAATMLLQLTGNALASQQLLRHRPGCVVTARHYLKAIPEALLASMKLVEDAVNKVLDSPVIQ